jgi:hypothetical protein
MELAANIAAAMAFLHAQMPPVLHHDLKSGNVLVFETMGALRAKLTDFGLSLTASGSTLASSSSTRHAGAGTPAWQAPEQFDDVATITTFSEVYAFAIIVWELLHGGQPWDGKASLAISRAVDRGERPAITAADGMLRQLMTECWLREPKQRPTFAAVEKRLALAPGNKWQFFLSHTQQNGDAKVLASTLFYEMKGRGYDCWFDVMMPRQDIAAMKEGVEKSECVLAIITGGDEKDKRYFERQMCVKELTWAINACKTIVPIVVAADKPKIGDYIGEGNRKGIDLSDCDFKHFDRSNPIMLKASIETILKAMEFESKGSLV